MLYLLQSLFWLALLGLLHTYIGYPLLMALLARLFPMAVRKEPPAIQCSVVISAYNEVETLPAKCKHLLNSPNAAYVGEILIGSDGSDDGTEQAVEALKDDRIRVHRFKQRRGKPAILNALVPHCRYEVVVLMDARQEVADGALSALLANFADARVGVVSGELVFRQEGTHSSVATGMDAYWRYEKFIRKAEARFRSVPGATGALYAIRRSLFAPINPGTLLDDVAIPMQAIQQGSRCIFESDAIIYDTPSRSGKAEEIRKRRTIAGNLQLARQYPSLLIPWRNPIWFEFVSHKMLRVLSPLFLGLLFFCNLGLVGWPELSALAGEYVGGRVGMIYGLYVAALIGQVLFVALGAVGLCTTSGRIAWSAPAMFLRLNWTTLLAWADAVRGVYRVDWHRST